MRKKTKFIESSNRPDDLPSEGTPVGDDESIVYGKYFVLEEVDEKATELEVENPDEAFKELVKRATPILKPEGFKKKGFNFVRESGIGHQRINFQKSSWRSSTTDLIRFTVNLDGMITDTQAPAEKVSWAMGSHFGTRIGRLHSEGLGLWWDLGSHADIPRVWNELAPLLSGPVLEWCNAASHFDGLAELISSAKVFVFPIEAIDLCKKLGHEMPPHPHNA